MKIMGSIKGGKIMMDIICSVPFVFVGLGYPIYKKIKHESVLESKIYIPVLWILCILGNVAKLFIAFCE